MAITLIFKHKVRRRCGHGAKGVLVPPEDGKLGILIPSFGALEQEEIDYILEAEKEKAEKQGRITEPRKIEIERGKDYYEVNIKEE